MMNGEPTRFSPSLQPVQPVVSLTFDNGPTAGVTERVLDILNTRDVPATFFVVGTNLADPHGRRASERAVADGHRLGGHTWSHTIPFGKPTTRPSTPSSRAPARRSARSAAIRCCSGRSVWAA